MPVKVITDVSEFERLREKWNALVETSAYPNIFTTWEWSFLWWKHFGQTVGHRDGSLFILLVESDDSDGELLAIFPLYRTGKGRFLYWIGYGARPCPEYLGPVIRHDAIDAAVQTVCDFLANDAGRWDRLFFEDYALDDPGTAAFADRLKQLFPYQAIPGESRYIIHLPDSYDAFLKGLSKSNRDSKKKRFNKSRTAFQATAEVLTGADLERGFRILLDLSAQSRQRLHQKSPYDQDDYRAFHKEILETLLPLNRVILIILKYAETPVGIWFNYTLNQKCFAYQQGCASDCEGSPGDITLQHLLIHLISNRFAEFDFLRGNQTFKSLYTKITRNTETLSTYGKKNVSYFRDRTMEQLYRPLKRFVKRLVLKLLLRKNGET